MIFIPSALLTEQRQMAVSANPFNTNLAKIQMDFGIHGDSRGMKMQYVAFSLVICIMYGGRTPAVHRMGGSSSSAPSSFR